MSKFSEMIDKQLVELIRQDDLAAFQEIYKRYWKTLYGAAFKRLKSKELSEEVVQELFTNLWIKRQSLVIKTELSNYLFSSVSHFVIDQYRKELIKQRYSESFKLAHSEFDNSTEEEITLKELKSTIAIEVSHLPDKCRSVYELSRVENKSNKEIANYLGISEKTVENHLTKALKRLRLGLSHYYYLIIALLLLK
jgi:RNA polymerase sigma-70 factor (family 1)